MSVISRLIANLDDNLAPKKRREMEIDAERLDAAIDALLDEVERPTGTLRAALPATGVAERALIALHDAVGRPL